MDVQARNVFPHTIRLFLRTMECTLRFQSEKIVTTRKTRNATDIGD